MVIVTAIVAVLVIVGVLWLFRSMGTFAQRPPARDVMKHNSDDGHHRGPRATGLN